MINFATHQANERKNMKMTNTNCHSRQSEARTNPIRTRIDAAVPLQLIFRSSIVAVAFLFLSNTTLLCSAEESTAAENKTNESTTADKSDSETSKDAGSETSRKGSEGMTTVYDFKEKTIDGKAFWG